MNPPNPAPTTAADATVIDPKQTHQIREFKHETALTTLRTDPAGRFVAAGAEDLDVQLWNLSDGERQTLKGHKSWVRCIDFTPDGQRMLTACWGGEIRIWDTSEADAKLLLSIQAHKGSARFVRVSPDGNKLATCGNDLFVRVWNLADGQLLHEFAGHDRHVYGVDFHPQGEHLVSQDLMGQIHIWDLKSGKRTRSIHAGVMTGYDNKFAADMGGARDLQFHTDGSQWASAGITNVVNSFAGIQDPILVVFDWEAGKIRRQVKSADANLKGIAWGVRFHPDNILIGAIADRSGKGELWFSKPEEETPFHIVKLKSAARGLDLLPDKTQLAVAHADGFVRLYCMIAKETDGKSPKQTS